MCLCSVLCSCDGVWDPTSINVEFSYEDRNGSTKGEGIILPIKTSAIEKLKICP